MQDFTNFTPRPPVEWQIFNRVPNAKVIAESIDKLSESWKLTSLREKKPYRLDWQTEPPIAREDIKNRILNGQPAVSKKGIPYTAYDSGYGLRTGDVSGGLIDIDLDGESSDPILNAMSGGDIPNTVSWTSGKPGRKHLLFQVPEEYREALKHYTRTVITSFGGLETASIITDKGNKKHTEILEFRYNKCQSALPPSRHPETGEYVWINDPVHTEIAIAPEWLCKLLLQYASQEADKAVEKEARKFNWGNLSAGYQATGAASNIVEFLNFEVLPRLSPLQIYNHVDHNFTEVGQDKLVGSPSDRVSASGTSFQVRRVGSDWLWYDFSKDEGGGAVQYRWLLRGGLGTPTGRDFIEIVKELASDAGLELPTFKDYKNENNSRTNTRKSTVSGNNAGNGKSTVPGVDDGRFGAGESGTSTETGRNKADRNNKHGFKKQPDLVVNKRFLGDIPIPTSGFAFINAAKGAGKTESSQEPVQNAIKTGRPVNLITHRIQLGRHLCNRLGLYWIEEKDQSAIQGRHIGLCIDSLWKLNPGDYKGAVIVIDEIEQVIWHLLHSSTCKDKRTLLLKTFREFIATVIATGGLVIGMDADLSQNTIDYLVALSGSDIEPWVCVNTWKPTVEYFVDPLFQPIYIFQEALKAGNFSTATYFYEKIAAYLIPKTTLYDFSNPARMVRVIEDSLDKDEKLYICCDSRDGRYSAKGLTQRLTTKYPGKKILCVDAVTSRTLDHPAIGFIDNINSEIIKWDVIICSPSIGSGVSIDVKGHFNKVFGVFNGIIPDWEARQALSRVREHIPRHVWCKSYGMGSVYRTARLTDPEKILQKLSADFNKNSKLAELIIPSNDIKKIMQGYHDPSHLIAFASIAASVNKCMWKYRESMYKGLLAEGYQVQIVSDSKLENQIWELSLKINGMSQRGICYEEIQPLEELLVKLRKELSLKQEPDKVIVKYLGATSKIRKQESYEKISESKLIGGLEFESLNKQKLRTPEQDYQLEKYKISQMYSEIEVTTKLVQKTKADNYHSKIQRYFFLISPPSYRHFSDRRQLASQIDIGNMFFLPDLRNRSLEADFLESINIMQWVNPDIEISGKSPKLLDWCEELLEKHKEVQLALGINLKPHMPEKQEDESVISIGPIERVNEPIKMLQSLLDYIGLRYIPSQRIKDETGERVRYYKLDTDVLNDERVEVFARWEDKLAESITNHQENPVRLPWEAENDEKGRVVIQNNALRPANSYIDNKTKSSVDVKPVDAEPVDAEPVDATPTGWKGIVTRIKDTLTGINSIWHGLYSSLRGSACTVDTEPFPNLMSCENQWLLWVKLGDGSCKSVPTDWLECAG
jgi:hypothetical protein